MAQSKTADSAEKAYAEASAEVKPAKGKPLVESLKADAAGQAPSAVESVTVPAKKAEKKVAVKKTSAKKPAARKVAPAGKALAKKPAGRKPVAKKNVKQSTAKPARAPVAAKTETNKLKEIIMATQSTDYTTIMTDTMHDAVTEMQTRAHAAYEKGTAAAADVTEFAKGNVEAVVESGKIMAEGVQALGKTYADEAKSAYETATADLKEMASVKSPTELFQLQGKILRRNFDAMVATTSKSTDAAMKLANDVFAPISGRVNVAAEKLSKVA